MSKAKLTSLLFLEFIGRIAEMLTIVLSFKGWKFGVKNQVTLNEPLIGFCGQP